MERKPKRKAELKQAGNVLQSLLEKGNSPLADQFQRFRLRLQWPDVVGRTISQVCFPCGFNKGKLYVCAKNSAWLNQLFYARKEIMKKVNSHLGQSWVIEIRLTLDSKDVPKEALLKEDQLAETECTSPTEETALQPDRSSR